MYCDGELYKRQVLIKLSDVAKFLYHDKEFVYFSYYSNLQKH